MIGFKSPDSNPGMVIVKTIAFFAVAIVGGFLFYKIFLTLDILQGGNGDTDTGCRHNRTHKDCLKEILAAPWAELLPGNFFLRH